VLFYLPQDCCKEAASNFAQTSLTFSFPFVKVDAAIETDLVARFGIEKFPSFVLFDYRRKTGSPVRKILDGHTTPQDFAKFLHLAASHVPVKLATLAEVEHFIQSAQAPNTDDTLVVVGFFDGKRHYQARRYKQFAVESQLVDHTVTGIYFAGKHQVSLIVLGHTITLPSVVVFTRSGEKVTHYNPDENAVPVVPPVVAVEVTEEEEEEGEGEGEATTEDGGTVAEEETEETHEPEQVKVEDEGEDKEQNKDGQKKKSKEHKTKAQKEQEKIKKREAKALHKKEKIKAKQLATTWRVAGLMKWYRELATTHVSKKEEQQSVEVARDEL